eukprot:2612495-Pleurochrysis_carterae.AAC.1
MRSAASCSTHATPPNRHALVSAPATLLAFCSEDPAQASRTAVNARCGGARKHHRVSQKAHAIDAPTPSARVRARACSPRGAASARALVRACARASVRVRVPVRRASSGGVEGRGLAPDGVGGRGDDLVLDAALVDAAQDAEVAVLSCRRESLRRRVKCV